MHIFFLILISLISLFALFIVLAVLRTFQMQRDASQKEFLKGKIPKILPEGIYKGHAKGYVGPWIGKSFDREKQKGMNVFVLNKKQIERFPFKTYAAKGLRDKSVDVLKIEYNISKNSVFLKMIMDEIVEIEKGKYLGKIHLRFIPGFPFTLGYFWLEK